MIMKRKSPDHDGNDNADATIMDVSGQDLSSAAGDNDASSNADEFFLNLFQQQQQQQQQHHSRDQDAITSLDVSRCRLGPGGTSGLLSFLSNSENGNSYNSSLSSSFSKLKSISLQRNAIGSSGGRAVGKFLQRSEVVRVETLDLSLNDIKAGGGSAAAAVGEPTAAEVISDGLKVNTTLKVLIMNKCALGPEGACHLSRALMENNDSSNSSGGISGSGSGIHTLELAGNMIGPRGGDHLFRALKSNTTLRRLGLRMNRIGGGLEKADVQSLAEALVGVDGSAGSGTNGGARSGITELDLSYNDLRCTGCAILSKAIAHNTCPLKELLLEKNDIDKDGCLALADALRSNDTLEKLVLKGNAIGDEGAVAMGAMLARNRSVKSLDLSDCSIGNEGGAALGRGLAQNSTVETLALDKNSLGSGVDASIFSVGISRNASLKAVRLSGNGLGTMGDAELWGRSVANALSSKPSALEHVDVSDNALSDPSIVDAAAARDSAIKYLDASDNNIEHVSIETQLLLSKRMNDAAPETTITIDLSLNPLSSPPLGRTADHSNLRSYLTLLANEKTAVTRMRLMVLGYGGVGKSTFCRAVTNEDEASGFQSTLVPVEDWGVDRVSDWAERLGTTWSGDAVRLIVEEFLSGSDLPKLIGAGDGDDNGNFPPSELLLDLCASKYPSVDADTFARAVSALCAKGYLSTVGAVKVEGTIQLGNRTTSLVDFAGQVEFLVSHQLLLSSMHTLCMIIQPAPSFGKPDHRHFGSWDYWSKFLSSLGDRRQGSLLLAVSQLDKVGADRNGSSQHLEADILKEFHDIQAGSSGAISCTSPLRLDYCPVNIGETISSVKKALSKSMDEVAHSWWVPLTYETLSDILQHVADRKSSNHELPILTKSELIQEMDAFCNECHNSSALMAKMKTDRKLLQRAINYLEAVGDVMQAGHEWLLIDPIGWFSAFLAHFIKDDLAVSTVQVDSTNLRTRQRGTVNLDEVVDALKHEYKSPQEHISQIMTLLCGLELCVPLNTNEKGGSSIENPTLESTSYLFPCLLPSLISQTELFDSCGFMPSKSISSASSLRGHRFREASGFIPPGLFVGILARLYQKLQSGIMHSTRMWKDHAILEFNNRTTRVLMRLDMDNAIIDVIGWAPQNEQLFVGAAKGQASVVIWMVHLIKMCLRSYTQLKFEESWLCPNPQCHGIDTDCAIPSRYEGSEFPLSPKVPHHTNKIKSFDCNVEGCYRFLGTGHSLQRMVLREGCGDCVCQRCKSEAVFTLRDKVA